MISGKRYTISLFMLECDSTTLYYLQDDFQFVF